jgi:uncharacterized membrane protein
MLILAQVLFTISQLVARANLKRFGFHVSTLLEPWTLLFLALWITATAIQIYIFSRVYLGQAAAMFGAASLVLTNVLGVVLLREVLSPVSYLGVALAFSALTIMAMAGGGRPRRQ